MAAPADTAPFPDRVGRYQLLLPLGSGGMARVFLARSHGPLGFERDVAIKVVHSHLREDHPTWEDDLVEEAKIAARIRHPNVVSVLDVDIDPAGPFLVMDYIEGDSLSALLRAAASGERLPTPIVIAIVLDVLAGLHAAHELRDDRGADVGLVHRDVSPQNVIVGVDGVARLTDFGVAKAASRVGSTATGMVKGKVGYMSPEQAKGLTLDRRSDVFAAGVVAWEALAGRRMHPRGDEMGTLFRIATEDAPALATVRPDLPAALDRAIASALVRDPERRCRTAAELRVRIADAWRAIDRVADSTEVGASVENLIGGRLRERRHRMKEVLELRARVRELTVASGTDPSPALQPMAARPDPERPASADASRTSADESRTSQAAVTASDALHARGRSRMGIAILVGGSAVAAAIAGSLLVARQEPEPRPARASNVASAANAVDTLTTRAAPTPSAMPSAIPRVPGSAPAPSTSGAIAIPHRRSPKAKAAPGLAPSPYEK